MREGRWKSRALFAGALVFLPIRAATRIYSFEFAGTAGEKARLGHWRWASFQSMPDRSSGGSNCIPPVVAPQGSASLEVIPPGPDR